MFVVSCDQVKTALSLSFLSQSPLMATSKQRHSSQMDGMTKSAECDSNNKSRCSFFQEAFDLAKFSLLVPFDLFFLPTVWSLEDMMEQLMIVL